MVKDSAFNAGDMGLISGSGGFPEKGNGSVQFSSVVSDIL